MLSTRIPAASSGAHDKGGQAGGVVDRSIELAAVVAYVDPSFDERLQCVDRMLVWARPT